MRASIYYYSILDITSKNEPLIIQPWDRADYQNIGNNLKLATPGPNLTIRDLTKAPLLQTDQQSPIYYAMEQTCSLTKTPFLRRHIWGLKWLRTFFPSNYPIPLRSGQLGSRFRNAILASYTLTLIVSVTLYYQHQQHVTNISYNRFTTLKHVNNNEMLTATTPCK